MLTVAVILKEWTVDLIQGVCELRIIFIII